MANKKKKSAPPTVQGGDELYKGQTLDVRVASLATGGEGVSKDFGKPIFINRVAPGDLVKIRLFDVRKDFAKAEVLELLEPSPMRAEPPCPIFNVCGGCQWQHMGYQHQLDAKRDIVAQAIRYIGKLDSTAERVLPTMRAPKPLGYRNKAQFPVNQVAKTGRILAGYFKQNSHDLVNIKHCPVQPEVMDRTLEVTKEILQSVGISGYDETTGHGLLRHIAERYSFDRQQILLTFVLNTRTEKLDEDTHAKLTSAAQQIMQAVPEVIGVCANINRTRSNTIMGDTTVLIRGEAHLIETLRSHLDQAPQQLKDGIQFRLSSTSFFQINSTQAEHLLDEVLKAATNDFDPAQHDKPIIIDAYAGVGTMGMWLAPIASKVIAIEEHPSSIQDGHVNLKLNNITNMEFIQAKVEDEVPKLLERGIRADVAIVDPPRKGIERGGLHSLIKLGARRIVYVSCNPATLARDLRILEENGYATKRIQPIDMFPQTYHVESVTLLEKTTS
jgi:23S rRNA (uracil1939-C5)-methyltransferase